MKHPPLKTLEDFGEIYHTIEVPESTSVPYQYVVMALQNSRKWAEENRLHFMRDDNRIPGRTFSTTEYVSRITAVSQSAVEVFATGSAMLASEAPEQGAYRAYNSHSYVLRKVIVFKTGAALLVVSGDRAPIHPQTRARLREYLEKAGKR